MKLPFRWGEVRGIIVGRIKRSSIEAKTEMPRIEAEGIDFN